MKLKTAILALLSLTAAAFNYGGDPAEKVEEIRRQLNLTTLKFNKLETLVKAIGLPKCKLCTHCFDGTGCCKH